MQLLGRGSLWASDLSSPRVSAPPGQGGPSSALAGISEEMDRKGSAEREAAPGRGLLPTQELSWVHA